MQFFILYRAFKSAIEKSIEWAATVARITIHTGVLIVSLGKQIAINCASVNYFVLVCIKNIMKYICWIVKYQIANKWMKRLREWRYKI